MDTEKLKLANIPESWQLNCYISTSGMIFTPQFDLTNVMIKTGEQSYNEWIANKSIAEVVQPTIIGLQSQIYELITALVTAEVI